MTDSMKFGPEWLRNMSGDTASSNSINTSIQITNPSGAFGSSNSSGGCDSLTASNNNSSNPNTSSLQNNVNATNSGASRNTFPEFRYGREEMLLLFDRNCGIPEILPSYKNLFVERVQFPLALVPSTDEELMQGSAPPAQRPGWLQRSPVGFNTAARGTGRVGCMERGRMRGKSIYHPVFQRPNAVFDEEQRSSAIKTDRSWAERNGGVSSDQSGSSAIGGGVGGGGGNIGTDAWNGNTPVSSPRREFSNHPRNMENWRRSRNEDGSNGEPTTNPTFSADVGWRINTSGFQNTHTRWGRSTSWRDDDLANNENSAIASGSTGTAIPGGVVMMRSNSTISTTHGERMGHSTVSGKSTGTTGVPRSISAASSGIRNSSSGNIWPGNAIIGTISNIQGDSITNDEMALPEWAMENPSDIGGTFDASGAFHGAIDEHENTSNVIDKQQENDVPDQSSSEGKMSSELEAQDKLSKISDDNSTKSTTSCSLKEIDNYHNSSSPSPTPPSNITASHESAELDEKSESSKYNNITIHNLVTTTDLVDTENVLKKRSETHSENEYSKKSITISSNNVQNCVSNTTADENNTTNSNVGDYAERMRKVTDDMIEKLIMDDEDTKDDNIRSSMLNAENEINGQNMYIAMQKPQNSNHPSTVSPALDSGATSTGPPNMSLYNMGSMMVDHTHNLAALHQLQQQQMTVVAIGLQPTPPQPHPIISSASSDLWLYRDPQSKVQGPFSDIEMTEWYRAGYFNDTLLVRRVCDARYRPLGELLKICNGQIPFSHTHLIPIDLNPTALTPPLPSVISAQPSPQTNDFLMKTLNEHQHHQQTEKLKGNVTTAADSLNTEVKSVTNTVDISQVLNMHFQTLQDRFIHNQEVEIANELSKNDCFRRLSPAEQEAVVRQKLQTLGLPEYLTNLSGLSNSLAALNPTAGTQLYDTITECTKKEQLFSNHQGQSQTSAQQQRSSHHASSSSTPYLSAEDFIMKTKKTAHDMNSNNDLLNEFNLRIFLNNGSDSRGSGGIVTQNCHGHEFLNDQQLFGTSTRTTPNPSNNNSQSPMMQLWMNSLTANQTNLLSSQHSLISNAPQPTAVNNQWLNCPLAGISSISLSREQQSSDGNVMGSPKPTPASMWDVTALEQHVQVQQQQQQQKQQMQQQLQQQAFEHHRHHLKDNEKHLSNHNDQYQDVHKQSMKQEENSQVLQKQQRKPVTELQKCIDSGVTKEYSANTNNNYKQEQQSLSQSQSQSQNQQPCVNEKPQSQSNNKRNGANNTNAPKLTTKFKENLVDQISKKTEEERRREQNEEKRRLKEERKRQQMEEEKRRVLQAEEEKRRQIQEEEKRQQQIQAQRRKALMSNSNNNNSLTSNNSNNPNNVTSTSVNIAYNQKSKEQQRIQSSVAPWSAQTMSIKSQGPGLAEIQKAERRERRADQQRQLEIQEKHLRALAAAAEAHDTVLKWNAAPMPVKSFAEIQAEEAKRLAHEQIELQRRKEQEAHNNLVAFNSTANTVAGNLNNTSNIASIWSGNKIWGTSASTLGFWEEPLKFNNKSISVTLSNSNNVINNSINTNLTAASIVSQSPNLQQKLITAQQQQQHNSTTQSSVNKNIKKSQSVAVMQNTVSPQTVCVPIGSSNQKKQSNNNAAAIKQVKSQKADINFGAVGGCGTTENKKNIAKVSTAANKGDDFEAEFINWCTKSLNNMNAKVDVPTFVSFLRDLESPYEVKDYIRMYLGESKEYIDFSKQFLERRSKYKNLQRAQNAHDDDLCKPAQAITPSVNDSGENKAKQKKIKKNKMTKLDARILGFSVTAAEGRINVGDRDYGDIP